jgi:anti-anti-sigma regulatory factor
MNERNDALADKMSFQCPVCGSLLPDPAVQSRSTAPCWQCGSSLWCCKRAANGDVILEFIPGRTPEIQEINRVVESLLHCNRGARVVFNLSHLEAVTSLLIARLVAMNRRIRSAGGRLFLCEVLPGVRYLINRVRLDKILEIVDREEDALSRV